MAHLPRGERFDIRWEYSPRLVQGEHCWAKPVQCLARDTRFARHSLQVVFCKKRRGGGTHIL